MRTIILAAALAVIAPHANASPFSNEVDCEDALAPWSDYGKPSYERGQDFCLQQYDHDRETERRLKALEDRED